MRASWLYGVKRQYIFLGGILCFSMLFMPIWGTSAVPAAMPQEVNNHHYLIRYETDNSVTPNQNHQLTVFVQKIDSGVQKELVIGGKAFEEQYGRDSIVNIQSIQFFETFLIVHGETWNNGGLILIFNLETGEPQQIAGENIAGAQNGIAIWCYQPVTISKSGEKVAFVNGYPRNARGVHEVVSVLDLNNLTAPPIPVYPTDNKTHGTLWRLEDENMFIGIMGNMIWTPDEKGIVFFEGTTINDVREHIDFVYIDLSEGTEHSRIFKESFDPTPYLTKEFKQRDHVPYFFPILEMGDDEHVKVHLDPSVVEQETRPQSKVPGKRQSIWKIEIIHIPLPHH